MSSFMMVYRPGGMNIAKISQTSLAQIGWMQAETVPDSAEHDRAKECIEIHKIEFCLPRTMYTSILAAATTNLLRVGWRPGSFAHGTALISPDKAMLKSWWLSVGAVTLGYPLPHTSGAVFDFTDNPVIGDPAVNSFGVDVSSSGATTYDATGSLSVFLHYKWVKAGVNELSAYLNWEALGAQ